MASATEKDKDTLQCISDCLLCHGVCIETADYCLRIGGRYAYPYHIRAMLDCSDICITSADFMLRGSVFSPRICDLCSEVSNRCAESCDQFLDDDRMAACAEICRNTLQSCRRIASRPPIK